MSEGQAHAMRSIFVEKVTLNMGTGKEGERMEKAVRLLTVLTGRKPMQTITRKRIPDWGVRPGLPLGVKVTLRRQPAVDLLKRLFTSRENKIEASNFGLNGEFAFGITEYIDIPGIKYDPTIGVMGFDVCVTLQRAGFRIRRRRKMQRAITSRHHISRDEAIAFVRSAFGVEVVS